MTETVSAEKTVVGSLVGVDGNAFMLMGHFSNLAKKQGWSSDEISAVIDEAKAGDYNHLVKTLHSRMSS